MKQIFHAFCVFAFTIVFGSFVIWFALHEREERDIDLSGQNIHTVRCMDEYGNLDTYYIHIPNEVKDLDKFAEGFCESL